MSAAGSLPPGKTKILSSFLLISQGTKFLTFLRHGIARFIAPAPSGTGLMLAAKPG